MTSPLVSVITAVYNGSPFIATAIRSVLRQSYANIELIVVNDGSDDNTESIVLKLAATDQRIRYFRQENAGVSSARNLGIRNMKGDYFMLLDADDCLTQDSISVRIEKFRTDPELCYCDGGVIIFDEKLKTVQRVWKPSARGLVFRKLIRLSESCFFGPTWLVRCHPSENYVFEETMTHAEDLLFFISLSRSGRYDFVNEDVLMYRSSSRSAMKNLKGLAVGYQMFRGKIVKRFGEDVTLCDRLWLWFKVRKIMTLSFFSEGRTSDAFRFLVTGDVR